MNKVKRRTANEGELNMSCCDKPRNDFVEECFEKEEHFDRDNSFADFYAVVPPDDNVAIPAGGDIQFPEDGPMNGKCIVRKGLSSFRLRDRGTYLVMFEVDITTIGQLVITVNDVEQNYTVFGSAVALGKITGMALIRTRSRNSIITIRNPLGAAAPLLVVPSAGGSRASTAHLVITQLK